MPIYEVLDDLEPNRKDGDNSKIDKANIDASNLSDENKESWRNSLVSAGNGINIENGVISVKNNDFLSWKLVGQATGKTAISLSSLNGNYNEILIVCSLVGAEAAILDNVTINIPKARILSTDQIFACGNYYSTATYLGAYYNVSSTRVALNNGVGNGSNLSSGVITYVYYR